MKYLNRLLDDEARKFFKHEEDLLWEKCPDVMKDKIPEANVQQAFTLYTVDELSEYNATVLCVGCFADSTYYYLQRSLYNDLILVGIDPAINMNLHTFAQSEDEGVFDIIFSTSVIEHVENDEEFIEDICKLLKRGGTAILTCDFNKNYVSGNPVPATVVRQYTKSDFMKRFIPILDKYNCSLLTKPNWNGEPDFTYQGHKYNFATFVFYKE